MASIKDFFGAAGTGTLTRTTHGTTGQAYTWSCCSACCYCIPSSATTWVGEMWGQGAGSGNNCCCEWGCRGGGGANYGSQRMTNFSCGSARTICYCGCTCYCQTPSSDGAPGQFSKITDCTGPFCTCIGGGQPGCACCNYGGTPNYMQDVNPEMDFNASSGGGGATGGTGGNQYTGWQNVNTPFTQGGQDQFGSPFSGFTGGASSGGGGGDSNATTQFPTGNSCCSSGCMTSGTTDSNNTFVSRRGALGFSRLGGQCNVSCIRGGGGASYAGGFQTEKCHQAGNWAYCGCNGMIPGGGAGSGGACGGGCCYGACGAPGVVLISYDN
mgnify:FL=1|tara:strand:- start:5008 stop:5985 length:978 start_codon:yes stop_codon:yes gene_type:complete